MRNLLISDYGLEESYGPSFLEIDETQFRDNERTLFQEAPPTDSPEFRNWFGDSKVVDENGEPLVVYHGTRASFTEFSGDIQSQSYQDAGIHFTPKPDYASGYATSFEDRLIAGFNDGANVMPLYISMENPAEVRTKSEIAKEGGFVTPEDIKRLQAEGYDGIVKRDPDGSINEAVAFRPTQIKSIHNRGTFDPDNPDILFQTDLAAFHNTTEENLRKSLLIGGMPAPSIAIKSADSPYTDFGNITLIANRGAIDPEADYRNEVYTKDAWTPRVPEIEYKPNNKALWDLYDRLREISDNEIGSLTSGERPGYAGEIVDAESPKEMAKILERNSAMQT